jgi:N-acetylneuraminic acid mutarotase
VESKAIVRTAALGLWLSAAACGPDMIRVATERSPLGTASWVNRTPPFAARESHAMAYDSARGKVVIFGGVGTTTFFGDLGDTWEWDGASASWTQRFPPVSPAPGWPYAMAYDSAREKMVLFGGDTWEWDGNLGTWTQFFPTSRPADVGGMAYDSARHKTVVVGVDGTWEWDGALESWTRSSSNGPSLYGPAIVYDSARGKIVLFGGDDGVTVFHDTWEWDGTTGIWTRSSTTGPSARSGHAMAYDSARMKTVLFSGGLDADLWEWDGAVGKWTQRPTSSGPSERHAHGMAYDSARRVTVLFGGDGYSLEPRADTWEWDGAAGTWTQRSAGSSPSPRWGQAMAYDASRDRVVLFGGYFCCYTPSETWEWNGSAGTWAMLSPPIQPSWRWGHAMTYDSARQRVVLFSGYTAPADTWDWDGAIWTPRTSTIAPSARFFHGLAYDSARARMVLFGGLYFTRTGTVGRLNDTWEWDGTSGAWTQRFPMTHPPPSQYSLRMIYDAARGKAVLFGPGTWEWDGAEWTARTATTGPWYINPAVAYDSARGKVVLFGGNNPTQPIWSADTWEWDGRVGSWTIRSASTAPAARAAHSMAYDGTRGTVVLFGGNSDGYSVADTWEYHPPIAGGSGDASTDAAVADAADAVMISDAAAPDAVMIADATVPDAAMVADADVADAAEPDVALADATLADAPSQDAGALDALGSSARQDAGTVSRAAGGCGCDVARQDSTTGTLAVLVALMFFFRPSRAHRERLVGRHGTKRGAKAVQLYRRPS